MRGVINIGAHYGEGYEMWLAQGVKNILFFEPVKENFEKMKKRIPESDNVNLFNIALGNETGQREMCTESRGLSCSLLVPGKHLIEYPGIIFDSKQLVSVYKLDDIGYDRSLFDYICLQAQGYELEILKGAENSLEYIMTINVQIFKSELYKGCPLIEDITEYLFDRGFELTEVKWRDYKHIWCNANYEKN